MKIINKSIIFFLVSQFFICVNANSVVIQAGETQDILGEIIKQVGDAHIKMPEVTKKEYTYLDDASCRLLIEQAKKVRENAYVPYSKFKVGAAVLCVSGKIYTGVNVENASFGLTVCAERIAIFKAISEGEKEIKAIAIVSDDTEFITPCGACRQVIAEFGKEVDVVMATAYGNYIVKKIEELLPFAFTLDEK